MTSEQSAALLEKAAALCVSRHAGQRDKVGAAYFLHPMRVALRCRRDDEKIVALLHDIIEDTDLTPSCLRDEGFPDEIVEAILSVTKHEGETYEDFVRRAAQNPIGRVVKLHDLEDNLDVLRLRQVDADMAARFTKYLAAHRYLTEYQTENTTPEEHPEKAEPKSLDQYYRDERRRINSMLEQQMTNPAGNNYNRDTLSVRMPGGKVVANPNAIDTFIAAIQYLGYDNVERAGILHHGKYPLLTSQNIEGRYKEATLGRYVLSNCSNKLKAIYLNRLADALNALIVAELIAK